MKHDATIGHQKTRTIKEFDCCTVDWEAVIVSRDHYSISTIFTTAKRTVTKPSLTTKLQIHIGHLLFQLMYEVYSIIVLTFFRRDIYVLQTSMKL